MIHNAKSEPAVSPVIGTILLVAIAVVLVAIILVVIMGFSGDTNEKKVGLNAKSESGANATLILYGGASIDELVKLEMIDQGSPNGTYVKLWDINENGTAFVGLPYLAKGVAQPLESMAVYDTRINVRGTFSDGSEVILLVQPMTFFDVTGLGEGPIISEPTMAAAGEDSRNKIFSVKYSNATEAPKNCTIVYHIKDDSENTVRIDTGTGTEPSGSFSSGTVTLETGVTYVVWGEITIDGKTYQGPKKTITISDLTMAMTQGTEAGSSVNKILSFRYSNAPLIPTETYICYQVKGNTDESKIVRIDTGEGTSKSTTLTAKDTIQPGYRYEYWGELVIDGELFKSSVKEFEITAPRLTVTNYGESLTKQIFTVYYQYPPSALTERNIYYQLKDKSEPAVKIEKGAAAYTAGHGQESFISDEVTLGAGTYIVWGEIVTPYGTFKSSELTVSVSSLTITHPVRSGTDANNPLIVTFRLPYRNTAYIPDDVIMHYQLKMSGGNLGPDVPVSSGPGTLSLLGSGENKVIITFDEPGTYRIWTELVMPDSTRPTSIWSEVTVG